MSEEGNEDEVEVNGEVVRGKADEALGVVWKGMWVVQEVVIVMVPVVNVTQLCHGICLQ